MFDGELLKIRIFATIYKPSSAKKMLVAKLGKKNRNVKIIPFTFLLFCLFLG